MTSSNSTIVFIIALLASAFLSQVQAAELRPNTATSTKGMVASVHPLATDAGVAALRRGGNAVDAAIATALTLGVVDPHNSGLGGGCFILIRRADGKMVAIDGRETAPAKASRDMYLRDGKADPDLSQTGPLAVATPGALAAYELALKEHGRLKLADLARPAAEIAEQGFVLDSHNAGILARVTANLKKVNGGAAPMLKEDGSPYKAGETLRQPDLAKTYRAIAEQGSEWFYRGELAKSVGTWMAEHGGILSTADFAAYRTIVREPLVTTYRGRTIVGFPPTSSGGVHVAQILNILENYDVKAIHDRDPGQFTHLVAEAMKLAFADRAYWLGDPAFTPVPRGLVDKEYAKGLAAKINLAKASPVAGHGTPPAADESVFAKHTTHLTAADSEGNWVALTQTINTSYGSKVIVPGTGVLLNNEMDDFAIAPGTPNAFGLIGAEANAVAPGKRPLSSMSPTIVLENGQPVLTVGAAGGPTIITQVAQALVRTLDLGRPLDQAIAAPRIHQQWSPDEVRIEKQLGSELSAALTSRGHQLKPIDKMGVSQGIRYDAATKTFFGVHDPRSGQGGGTVRGTRGRRRRGGEGENFMATVKQKDSPSPPLPLSLSFLVAIALTTAAHAQPDDPPGRWQLETLTLRDESKLAGLVQSQTDDEIDFAQIVQPPGKPMFAVIRPFAKKDVAKIEQLPPEKHQQLVQRFVRFRGRAVIEAGRMEQVSLVPGPNGAAQSHAYDGPWFSVYSTADEEQTRRAVVRIEQVFRAYRTLLSPRVKEPLPLTVELFGSLDQYRGRLKGLELALDNAAFYSPRERIILAGSDLNLFAERLAQVRREHEQVKKDFARLEAEYVKTLALASDELKAAGFSGEEAAAEIRLRKAVWKEQMESLLAANSQRQRTNEQKVAEVTGKMYRGLYHEAFHAYLDTFVYPHDRHHVPRWLNEGLAQVFESGQLDGDSLRIDAPDAAKLAALQADLATGQPLPLARLLVAEEREFLGPHARQTPQRHYLYAWGLAYYLAFQENLLGSAALDEFVAPAAEKADPQARFEKLIGRPLGQFEPQWRQALLKMK